MTRTKEMSEEAELEKLRKENIALQNKLSARIKKHDAAVTREVARQIEQRDKLNTENAWQDYIENCSFRFGRQNTAQHDEIKCAFYAGIEHICEVIQEHRPNIYKDTTKELVDSTQQQTRRFWSAEDRKIVDKL